MTLIRLVAACALLAASLVLPASALAADPTFGTARATAEFLTAVEVEQPVTLPAGVQRVEAVVRAGIDARTFLATIPTPGVGPTTLRYSHPTPAGSMYPNTPVELGFRITFEDGRIVDGPTTTIRYEDDRVEWRTLDDSLVRVHWYDGDEAFGRRALAIGEQAIEDATSLLGVEETEPIDFFVYADRKTFYDVLGPALQENIGGIALPEIRTMFANIPPSAVNDAWVGIVIPHELTHLVFDTATGNPYHEPPHWLDEGLADYIAQGYDAGARVTVERAARTGEIMPLRALVGSFPSTAERFSLAYDESVSAIDYLVRTHGQDALVKLIRSYAEGVSDDVAFTAALGVDAAGFEAAWLADLRIAEPPPFGPQPAPPGPLPPGWTAAVVPTPGPGSSVRPIPLPVDNAPGADLVAPVILGVVIALGLVIVAGIIVTARGLNRGDPLLAPPGAPPIGAAMPPPPDASPPATDDASADGDPRNDSA